MELIYIRARLFPSEDLTDIAMLLIKIRNPPEPRTTEGFPHHHIEISHCRIWNTFLMTKKKKKLVSFKLFSQLFEAAHADCAFY